MSLKLRDIALLLALLVPAALSCAPAYAEGWHFVSVPTPPAPEGQSSVGVPIPLGNITDIEFWAPNRGLLMTAGNAVVPPGLYYYNGVSWSELSTVCGGSEGRIAWAGPDDFWTISDQRPGQEQTDANAESLVDRSLCHFENGRVVASYAEPIGVQGSYEQMDAAACSGPNDCWFGGAVLPGTVNTGAFHLHWNGQTLSPVPSLETFEPQLGDPGYSVADIVYYNRHFYESVQIGGESGTTPVVLHRIVEGSSQPFAPLITETPIEYGAAQPWQLSAFHFSAASELWAIAGPDESRSPARAIALLLGATGFHQLALSDPDNVLGPGVEIAGIAAEPGSEDAWVSLAGANTSPLARIGAGGEVEPESLGDGNKGGAGAITCPAQGDCWLATGGGWLFHLGGDYPEDNDPNFQSLITYRPADAGLPFVAPDEAPPDDSGDEPPVIPAPPAPTPAAVEPPPVHEPLFSHVKERLVRGTTLALTFTLATKSHVRLLALRDKHQVAATHRLVLGGGRHTLELPLSVHRWPNKLDLEVQAIGKVPLVPAVSGPAGGPTTVSTRMSGALSATPLVPLP
jgi:hypothetical protein